MSCVLETADNIYKTIGVTIMMLSLMSRCENDHRDDSIMNTTTTTTITTDVEFVLLL